MRGDVMRRKVLVLSIVFILTFSLYMIITGFSCKTNVYLSNFSVSDERDLITLNVDVSDSIGHIRSFKDDKSVPNEHYLKFYSTWGGLNSSLGAKSEYTISLDEEDNAIYIFDGQEYKLVLFKKDNLWYKVSWGAYYEK